MVRHAIQSSRSAIVVQTLREREMRRLARVTWRVKFKMNTYVLPPALSLRYAVFCKIHRASCLQRKEYIYIYSSKRLTQPNVASRCACAGGVFYPRAMLIRVPTKVSSILGLISTISSHSKKMQQPILRAMLIAYFAFNMQPSAAREKKGAKRVSTNTHCRRKVRCGH